MKKLKLETDFIDFVNLCNKYEVEYLVIGGYAVSIHGYPRSTKDFDICIRISEGNAMKMVKVINDFIGYPELLKVKEKAGRPQDIADISKLKSRNRKK